MAGAAVVIPVLLTMAHKHTLVTLSALFVVNLTWCDRALAEGSVQMCLLLTCDNWQYGYRAAGKHVSNGQPQAMVTFEVAQLCMYITVQDQCDCIGQAAYGSNMHGHHSRQTCPAHTGDCLTRWTMLCV